jgi:hypothetical protein
MTTQLKLLAYGRPQVVVWTMNGDALLVGEKEGADMTAGTIQTGGAMGDLYGYSTFTGRAITSIILIWLNSFFCIRRIVCSTNNNVWN